MAKSGRDVKRRFSKIEKRSTGVCVYVSLGMREANFWFMRL